MIVYGYHINTESDGVGLSGNVQILRGMVWDYPRNINTEWDGLGLSEKYW